MKTKKFLIAVISLCVVLLAFTYLWSEQYYMQVSLMMMVLIMVPFFARFEYRKSQPEEIVLISLMAAIAAVARIPFASLPSVQPTSFVILVSALSFGGETGFLIGAVAALVSNLFLGQGPWTPWQMFAWGMMGLITGLLRGTFLLRQKYLRLIYVFLWGLVFGWFMNLWYLTSLQEGFAAAFLVSCISSFPMDAAHGITNVILIYFFAGRWNRILDRSIQKYGLR